jgi:intein/homing endonuclease
MALITTIDKKELEKLFIKEQRSASEIGRIVGLSTNQVFGQLQKHGIRKNKPRLTQWFNISFKKLTDDEIYLLGFLWADGYLSNKNRSLQCEIILDDFLDLEKTFNNVGQWGRYLRSGGFKKGVNRRKRMLLTISDVELVRKFISFDFHKKNYICPKKLLKKIPIKKRFLFYRGYSDGDGCFYITEKAKHFFIGSTYNQDWSHIKYLFESLSIKNYSVQKIISKLNHKDSRIRVSSKDAVVKIANYLYKDRLDLGLKRKYEKVKGMIDLPKCPKKPRKKPSRRDH